MRIENNIASNSMNFQGHKIPRYVYHLTNKKNYEAILNYGYIVPHMFDYTGYGIFMIELTNFFKRWSNDIFNTAQPLGISLLKKVANKQNNVVILKIPTAKLNSDYLFFRSQNRMNKFQNNNPYFDIALNEAMHMTEEKFPPNKNPDPLDTIVYFKKMFATILQNHNCPETIHCIFSDKASDSLHYKRNKEAIEYIYRYIIPIKDIEKIGEIDMLKKELYLNRKRYPLKHVFTTLLKDTPEVKGAELLKC